MVAGRRAVFEGGWLHRGSRARDWDVENELVAVSLLGDVTVDLASARTLPEVVVVKAFALSRDVDVVVAEATQVDLVGRPRNEHLTSDVEFVPGQQRDHVVRVEAHTALGDVTVHVEHGPSPEGT